jgi:hypothetical protein
MADNLNTFKNIGDTVSFDSLYRGIENMGKAIASARAAKAKAAAKSNDELQKMILTLDQQKGLTSLQAQKNRQDLATTLENTFTAAKENPNTTLSTFLTERQNYNMSSNMAVDQSKVEQDIRQKAGEGLISASVLDLYNQATKEGNMLPFLNPNVQLELNRQGIYVESDPRSVKKLSDGTEGATWAFVSAPSLAKPKSIVDEFAKIKNDPSNYTSTVSSVKTPTKIKGVFDNAVTETFTIKPEKVTELKEQLASDVGIQSLYRTDNELWNGKTFFEYEAINKDQTLQTLPQEEKLKLAAKRAIQKDIDAYSKNGLFNYDKKNLGTVTERADQNITINNKQNVIDNTALTASSDPKKIKGARALDAINDQAQLNAIAAKLKKNGDKPVRDKFNGKDIVYIRVGPGKVDAYYLEDATEQSAGFQTQKQKQGQGTGSFIYTPGSMSSELGFYDPETLAPVNESEVSKIMKEGTIDDVVKIKGEIYLKYTKTIKDEKGISLANENFYYVKMRKDGRLDRAVSSQYENSNGKKVTTMYQWDGWGSEETNDVIDFK